MNRVVQPPGKEILDAMVRPPEQQDTPALRARSLNLYAGHALAQIESVFHDAAGYCAFAIAWLLTTDRGAADGTTILTLEDCQRDGVQIGTWTVAISRERTRRPAIEPLRVRWLEDEGAESLAFLKASCTEACVDPCDPRAVAALSANVAIHFASNMGDIAIRLVDADGVDTTVSVQGRCEYGEPSGERPGERQDEMRKNASVETLLDDDGADPSALSGS